LKLIVGLGNPGVKYRKSRHNAGFMIVERFSDLHDIAIDQTLFGSMIGKGRINQEAVILAKPQTYMNLSGNSVGRLTDYFKIGTDDLIVIHDDLDLPFQTIRLKKGGGHGGHKGLLSLIDCLGERDFIRLRFGIGKPERKSMVEGYVLDPFSAEEADFLPELIKKAAEALQDILSSDIGAAMRRYNPRKTKKPAETQQ
jgi:PTH1 family peptidyl-tRNA hydrolase